VSGTAYTYSQIAAGGTPTDASGNYYTYLGQPVWAAGPALAEQRVQFAHDRGLQHIIIWELGQDLPPSNPNSLLRHAYEKNLSLMQVDGDYDGDRDVDAADYDVWMSTFGSTGDLRADGNRDGVVDGADYAIWRNQLTSAGSAAAHEASVPEPSVSFLFFLACFQLHVMRCGRTNCRAQ
jgi:hypothetical protein